MQPARGHRPAHCGAHRCTPPAVMACSPRRCAAATARSPHAGCSGLKPLPRRHRGGAAHPARASQTAAGSSAQPHISAARSHPGVVVPVSTFSTARCTHPMPPPSPFGPAAYNGAASGRTVIALQYAPHTSGADPQRLGNGERIGHRLDRRRRILGRPHSRLRAARAAAPNAAAAPTRSDRDAT